MRFVIVGAGGVGGYFGARLARAGESVVMVARGAHLDAIRRNGLVVRSSIDGEWQVKPDAVATVDAEPPPDAILLCVKAFDTDAALDLVGPLCGADTPVLSLQNGVEAIERIEMRLGVGHALGGAAYVFAAIEAPGVIAHRFGGRIVFGEPDGRITPRSERIRTAFATAGVPVELTTAIRRVLWEKYLFICAQAGMTALTRSTTGRLRATPPSWKMYRSIVEELAALGRRAGVELPPDVVDHVMSGAEALGPETLSSLCHDLLSGRRLELEGLHGYAVRLGERLGVPTPMLFAVYAALKPHAAGPAHAVTTGEAADRSGRRA